MAIPIQFNQLVQHAESMGYSKTDAHDFLRDALFDVEERKFVSFDIDEVIADDYDFGSDAKEVILAFMMQYGFNELEIVD